MENLFKNKALLVATVLLILAILAHLSVFVFGPDAFIWLGAGKDMARLASEGHLHPTLMTLFISATLLMVVISALSFVGAIRHVSLAKYVLLAFSAVLFLRALGFYWLMPMFPDNSLTFWLISSSICLVLACLLLLGVKRQSVI